MMVSEDSILFFRELGLENPLWETWEMAQWVKCLQWKHGD